MGETLIRLGLASLSVWFIMSIMYMFYERPTREVIKFYKTSIYYSGWASLLCLGLGGFILAVS